MLKAKVNEELVSWLSISLECTSEDPRPWEVYQNVVLIKSLKVHVDVSIHRGNGRSVEKS